jgi:hypothetical protein
MRRGRPPVARLLAAAVLGVTVGASAGAQSSPDCTVSPATFGNALDVCRKASDLFAFVVPQFGVALAGGNPVLGEGGTLGGWPKRTVTLRVTAVDGRMPKNSVPLTLARSAAVADDFGADRTPVPMASLDAAVGIFAGLPMGVTNIGGVDALLGVTGTPTVTAGQFQIRPQGARLALSYGVRVGVLQESAFVPGVSLSWMRRKVPTLDIDYTPSNDTLQARNIALTSDALRLVASKRFALIGFAAGIGRDEIDGTTALRALVNESVPGGAGRAEISFPTLSEQVTRNTVFVNASIGAPIARFVVEYGRSSAGTLRETINTFGGRRANEAYTYGSLGVTVRF